MTWFRRSRRPDPEDTDEKNAFDLSEVVVPAVLPIDRYQGKRVKEFVRRWDALPDEVKAAATVIRDYEAEGAYHTSILADPVRGFFRQTYAAETLAAPEDHVG